MKQKLKKAGKHTAQTAGIAIALFLLFVIWEVIGLLHQLAIFITHYPFNK